MAMPWKPEYTITNTLLTTIRQIGETIGEIRSFNLTGKALAELEISARELSSFASTSIEGNPLALTDVKRLLKTQKEHIRDTEREVLNYNQALKELQVEVQKQQFTLTIKTIEKVQKQVISGLMDNPEHCGKLRQEAVIIRNPRKLDEIVFLPPNAKDVRPLLVQLVKFINDSKHRVDPIILAGIFHRQHVIIHPFMDGNGRSTRLLTTALLGSAGLELFGIFSFENYYNQNITRYFKAVGLTGDYYDLQNTIDFTAWLEYFADGILDELQRVRKTLPDSIAPKPRTEPHHQVVLHYIAEHGSITQREYAEISGRSLASRKLDFEKLVNLGIIEPQGAGRGTYYVKVKN